MTEPEPRTYWQQFLDWEERAAAQGSGMTPDQMTGAAMFRQFLINHADDDAADAARVAAPSDGLREDREALWAKFTAGEKLAYGCGYRDGRLECGHPLGHHLSDGQGCYCGCGRHR